MIKNKIASIGLVLMTVSLVSCNDWFDVIPRSSVYEDDLYAKEQGFQSTLTGLYIAMGEDNMYGKEMTFGLNDVVSGLSF